MKTLFTLLVYFMTIILLSCQKDKFNSQITKGSLHVDIGLYIQSKEVKSSLKSAQSTGDFKVIIYKPDGTEMMTFNHASEMPDTIELKTGDYYVAAYSDNNLPAAFENPYYYGVSEIFTISSNSQLSVRVSCGLANTIVTVTYSDNTRNSFTDYKTTVSSALDSLIYLKNETRRGYFLTMPLNILVELSYLKSGGQKTTKTLSGSIPETLANRHYEIQVNASINEGMGSFSILMDSTEAQMELIEISEDPGNQVTGVIGYGGILITEVMYDPSALTDANGEWFEIYNNTIKPVNLKNLVLVRDTVNRHIIKDSTILSPGAYYVFKRTQAATNNASSYVYGSDISLPNTGAVLAIRNKDTGSGPGNLIFSVNYGGNNFPYRSGASISLRPDKFNAADAVLGTSWCISTSVYSTGDAGTPGLVNDLCR
jgi:hypothetical protein